MTMTRQECEELLSRIINASKADETFVLLNATNNEALQVAANSMNTPVSYQDIVLQISVRFGAKYATVSINSTSDQSVSDALARAESLAHQVPDAPVIVPFPDSTVVLESPLHTYSSEDVENQWRIELAYQCSEAFREAGLSGTGSLTASESATAIATSNGLFLYQPSFHFHSQFRAFSSDGRQTGFHEIYSHDKDLTAEVLTGAAIAKCLAWRDPVNFWPDSGELMKSGIDTVFESRALAEIMKLFIGQFSGDAIEQNRSFLRKLDGSSFVGNRLFPREINLTSNPFSTKAPSMPFTLDGTEVRPASWIKNGVIESIAMSRYEAFRQRRTAIAAPTNLILEGGETTFEEIIAGTERGLLVSGFADLSPVDYNDSTLQGSTRDGLFLIEDGEITSAVENLVFRDSAMKLLEKHEQLGKQSLTQPAGIPFPMLLPALKTKAVKYSGPSGII